MNPSQTKPAGAQETSLAPRLIKGLQADYTTAEWPGENVSGLQPIGDYVLVKMDECGAATMGGVQLPDDIIEKMNLAAESGCIFAVGDGAFTRYDDGRPWSGAKPQAGERVYVEKYSGIVARGKDGGTYRIMGYRCIAANMDVRGAEA